MTAVRVVRDAKTNVGKGFAFVEFASPAAARMALALNGTEARCGGLAAGMLVLCHQPV